MKIIEMQIPQNVPATCYMFVVKSFLPPPHFIEWAPIVHDHLKKVNNSFQDDLLGNLFFFRSSNYQES